MQTIFYPQKKDVDMSKIAQQFQNQTYPSWSFMLSWYCCVVAYFQEKPNWQDLNQMLNALQASIQHSSIAQKSASFFTWDLVIQSISFKSCSSLGKKKKRQKEILPHKVSLRHKISFLHQQKIIVICMEDDLLLLCIFPFFFRQHFPVFL